MPLHTYLCKSCGHESKLFSHEEILCEGCKSQDVEKQISIPQRVKNTVKGDKFHNKSSEPDVREVLLKRSREHSLETLKETIDKVGTQIAKEKGWIKKDGSIITKLDEK